MQVCFPNGLAGSGVERIDNAVVAIEENDVACEGWGIGPFGLWSIKIAGEMPSEMACRKIKAEQIIALSDGIDRVALSNNVGRDAKVAVGRRSDKILPAGFACVTVEGVDVALLADVGADDNQVARD